MTGRSAAARWSGPPTGLGWKRTRRCRRPCRPCRGARHRGHAARLGCGVTAGGSGGHARTAHWSTRSRRKRSTCPRSPGRGHTRSAGVFAPAASSDRFIDSRVGGQCRPGGYQTAGEAVSPRQAFLPWNSGKVNFSIDVRPILASNRETESGLHRQQISPICCPGSRLDCRAQRPSHENVPRRSPTADGSWAGAVAAPGPTTPRTARPADGTGDLGCRAQQETARHERLWTA
jgi:hypothetical protein